MKESVRLGNTHSRTKPVAPFVQPVVKSTAADATVDAIVSSCKSDAELFQLNFVGESATFRNTLKVIERVARTEATVLIKGETGTGKELAARAIHYLGNRREHPFVPVNCGALPDSLVENELFGHQRGAFTGAADESPGLLRLAKGGTLFLDEVDSLPLKAQVSLLRVLQDRRFRPLGGRREEEADIRVVAACNRDLETLIRQGEFRADLYYRLNLMSVELPPLRTRGDDVALLAEYFIRACAQRYAMPSKTLDGATLAWLPHYRWPGNVRELENLIHSHFLLSEETELTIQPPSELSVCMDGQRTHLESSDESDEITMESHSGLPAYAQAKAQALAAFDRNYLRKLLDQSGGNVTHAARLAGKERRALGKLIKRYKLSPDLRQ